MEVGADRLRQMLDREGVATEGYLVANGIPVPRVARGGRTPGSGGGQAAGGKPSPNPARIVHRFLLTFPLTAAILLFEQLFIVLTIVQLLAQA